MIIDAILSPAELPSLLKRDLSKTACVVFDILRATSTFVTALHHGAKAVIPVAEIPEALAIKKKQPGVLLGGEREGVRIRAAQTGGIDFDFGNSPREYTADKVAGKTIVSSTTNGTRAFRACPGAKTVLAGSFLNLDATAAFLREQSNILLVCAGTHESAALEDILAAGAMCDLLAKDVDTLSDAAQTAFHAFIAVKEDLALAVSHSRNARRVASIPELQADIAYCLQNNTYPFVAAMDKDGQIRKI